MQCENKFMLLLAFNSVNQIVIYFRLTSLSHSYGNVWNLNRNRINKIHEYLHKHINRSIKEVMKERKTEWMNESKQARIHSKPWSKRLPLFPRMILTYTGASLIQQQFYGNLGFVPWLITCSLTVIPVLANCQLPGLTVYK